MVLFGMGIDGREGLKIDASKADAVREGRAARAAATGKEVCASEALRDLMAEKKRLPYLCFKMVRF